MSRIHGDLLREIERSMGPSCRYLCAHKSFDRLLPPTRPEGPEERLTRMSYGVQGSGTIRTIHGSRGHCGL